MLSDLMTVRFRQRTRRGDRKMCIFDVSRAHFHSPAARAIYIKLPPEDHTEGMCGRLKKAMYGNRDAVAAWERECARVLVEIFGIKRGQFSPSLFYREERDIKVMVHGNDFVVNGFVKDLDWFEEMLKQLFTPKNRGTLGPYHGDTKEIVILNRVVRYVNEEDADEPYRI